MKLITAVQQNIFEEEISNLVHVSYTSSDEYLQKMGFLHMRHHDLANYQGDEVELDVFEDNKGHKVVLLCVTHSTCSEGDLLYCSCFASASIIPLLKEEHERYHK